MPYVTEQNLTDIVVERWKDIPDPRLREVMRSLLKHLHAFVREIEPTEAEWMTAIEWLTKTGKLCTDKRQEFILASDVLGVSMLVDCINHRLATTATPSTVTGPFHIHDSPKLANGADMAAGAPGEPCFVTGTVRNLDGTPISSALLDIWQTDGEGLYEAQRDVNEPWMRGIYESGPDGRFVIRTVAPIGYSIPMDGSVGDLMNQTNISHMRPTHIHFMVEAPGHHRLVTHIFQRGCQYIDVDAVYGVKAPLIVDFQKMPAGSKAPTGELMNTPFYVVNYDFALQKLQADVAPLRGIAAE
jgi:hydroxyquinol 1,2-dioxygenase